MKKVFIPVFVLLANIAFSQELYPFSEPASNMPARSVGFKVGAMYGKGVHSDRLLQRYTPELQLSLSKKWMLHGSVGFSDMHQPSFYFESARLYAKWRFLSNDEVHRHFRMAAFGAATYSRNHLDHNEINLWNGDQSGVQAGIIATQLWHKFALSGTVALSEVLNEERGKETVVPEYAFQSLNYSLSAGLLILPVEYKNYDQTNLNLYVELLGSRNLDYDLEQYYIDLAPSVQLIFKSISRLNIGYRFQLKSDIYRLMKNSWMISYEYLFLNALKKKN